MVDMNSDHIFEVPDTPDRIQQPTCPVSSSAATRGITAVNLFEVPDTPDRVQLSTRPVSSSAATRGITRMPGDPSPNRIMKFKIKNYSSNQGQSSRGSATGELRAPLATGDLFKQAEVARLLPEAKQSPPKLDRATGKSVANGYGARTLGLGQSSSISNNMISGAGVSGNSCQMREGKFSHRDASHRKMDFLGVESGLPIMPVGKPQNRTKSSTSNGLKEAVGTDDFSQSSLSGDKREAVNFKGTAGLSSLTPCDVSNRHVGQRKLVRNGFISPSNIVQRSLKADEKQEMCSTSGVLHQPDRWADVSHEGNIIDLTDSPTVTRKGNTVTDRLISVNNMRTDASEKIRMTRAVGSLITQGANQASSSNCSEGFNNRGKEIIHDLMLTERSGEDNTMRVSRRAVVDSSVVNGDISGISSQQGWRKTHNHTSKLSRSLLDTMTTSCGIESGSSGPSNQGHETAVGDSNYSFSAATTTRPTSRTANISKGKRKLTSSSYYPGDSSSSLHEHSGSDMTAGRNHTTVCHDSPVIDIDDLYSPEVRPSLRGNHDGTSIGPNISAQLEADEMLARQLQEQLYNETPRVAPREDIDAIVAMSLQHEEDAVRTSRHVRRFQNETPRVAPREDIDAIMAMSLQHEEDAVRTSRPARRFQNDTRAARASRSSAAQRAIRARYETAISDMRNAAPMTLGLRAMIPGYPGLRIQPNIDFEPSEQKTLTPPSLAVDVEEEVVTGAGPGTELRQWSENEGSPARSLPQEKTATPPLSPVKRSPVAAPVVSAPDTELRDGSEEDSRGGGKKKVTFDMNVTAYEDTSLPPDEEGELSEPVKCAKDEDAEQTQKSVVLPENHRYGNCTDSEDDEDEYAEDDNYGDDSEAEEDFVDCKIDLVDEEEVRAAENTEESHESLFSLPMSNDRQNGEEVSSPVPKSSVAPAQEESPLIHGNNHRDRSQYVRPVLNPVQNLSQWKEVKAQAGPVKKLYKENVNSAPDAGASLSCKVAKQTKVGPSNSGKAEVSVDASLSTWLVSSDNSTVDKAQSKSPRSVSSVCREERPVLGALTVDDLKQSSATPSPRRSPSHNREEVPILGTVGSYWSSTKQGNEYCSSRSDSGSTGIPNTTSKYREDRRVNWHSTPFNVRLDKALKKSSA